VCKVQAPKVRIKNILGFFVFSFVGKLFYIIFVNETKKDQTMIRQEKLEGRIILRHAKFEISRHPTKIRTRAYKGPGAPVRGKGKGAKVARTQAKIRHLEAIEFPTEAARYDRAIKARKVAEQSDKKEARRLSQREARAQKRKLRKK